MKYFTIDGVFIGEVTKAGNYCWTCKQLLPPKEIGCQKCKETVSKNKMDSSQIPGSGVYESDQFTWAVNPSTIMTGRIWYVKNEETVIPVGYFRDIIDNTCALQHYNGTTTHNNTLERSKPKSFDCSHIMESIKEDPKPAKEKKAKPVKKGRPSKHQDTEDVFE